MTSPPPEVNVASPCDITLIVDDICVPIYTGRHQKTPEDIKPKPWRTDDIDVEITIAGLHDEAQELVGRWINRAERWMGVVWVSWGQDPAIPVLYKGSTWKMDWNGMTAVIKVSKARGVDFAGGGA